MAKAPLKEALQAVPPPPTPLEVASEADVEDEGEMVTPVSERLQVDLPDVRAELTSSAKPGRKSQRFSLYINCIPSFGRSKVVRLEREFLAWMTDRVLPLRAPGKTYYQIPFFDRQKLAEAAIGDFVQLLGTAHVVAVTADQDSRYIVGMLRSYASVIIESIGV
jgi:hypothetical protein